MFLRAAEAVLAVLARKVVARRMRLRRDIFAAGCRLVFVNRVREWSERVLFTGYKRSQERVRLSWSGDEINLSLTGGEGTA